MSPTYSAKLDARDRSFGLVMSRFNEFIVGKLVEGAVDCLVRHGAEDGKLTRIWVPGSFELPLAAQKLAQRGSVDAIIALGCVIRGATPHFEYVAAEATKGLGQVALQTGVPIGFGLLTCDTLEQAIERAGTKGGNKGWEAAAAALEMANLLRDLDS